MRFPKLTVLFAAAVAVFADYSCDPTYCSTGIQCCDITRPATAADVSLIWTLLGLVVPVGTQVWVTCTTLLPGQVCAGKTVCCENVAQDHSIAIGCINVIV